jgi:hypothetical protein
MTGKNGGALLDRPKPTAGCSANGRRRRRGNLNTRDHFEELDIDLIKMELRETGFEGMDWITLAQEMERVGLL